MLKKQERERGKRIQKPKKEEELNLYSSEERKKGRKKDRRKRRVAAVSMLYKPTDETTGQG